MGHLPKQRALAKPDLLRNICMCHDRDISAAVPPAGSRKAGGGAACSSDRGSVVPEVGACRLRGDSTLCKQPTLVQAAQ